MKSWSKFGVGLVILLGIDVAYGETKEAFFYSEGQRIAFRYVENAADALELPVVFSPAENGAVGVLTRDIVVALERGTSLATVAREPQFVRAETLPFGEGYVRATFATPIAALNAANNLHDSAGIRFAHPDFRLTIEARQARFDDEPYYPLQWHLANTGQSGGTAGADIDAPKAWQATLGDPETLVAVIDLGFEQSHPELSAVWFQNSGETPGNKKDDDNNGFVDDVSGWNFAIDGANLLYGANNKHGTAVAGIIAAPLDGKGVVGVCPRCRVLPIVVEGTPSKDAAALHYANQMRADVITNSWGYTIGTPRTDVVSEALTKIAKEGRDGKGTPILFAMTNRRGDDCRKETPDISAHPEVIAVSAVDHDDRKVESSGFGSCTKLVGPSAPTPAEGKGLVTTDRVGEKGYNDGATEHNLSDPDYNNGFSGTSAATPVVAGTFGLLLSLRPDLTRDEALAIVTESADKVSAKEASYDPTTGHSKLYGFGRVNAGKAIETARSGS